MVNYGFLSTYLPTQSGPAGFCATLMRHLADSAAGENCGVVPMVGVTDPRVPRDRVVRLISGQPLGALRAARALGRYDVLIVQYEDGAPGGPHGEDVLDVLDGVDIPVIVVLHTVAESPTVHQRFLLQRVVDAAAAVVVMSRAAAAALLHTYLIDANRVAVIPHGASAPGLSRPDASDSAPPMVLTWGLIGPDKGIEWAIAALAHLQDLHPSPRYLVAGRTHPDVLAEQGESYREFLHRQAWSSGMSQVVEFDPAYQESERLAVLMRRAAVVLLPYDAPQQFVSGVLSEAIAAQRPVVATDFPHARELLAAGTGLIVPRRDPPAMAHALRRVLTEPGLAETLSARCGDLARTLDWHTIARSYRNLAKALLAARTRHRTAR